MPGWRLDKSRVNWNRTITSAAQDKLDMFQNEIFNKGTDPRIAAKQFDSHCECLDRTNNIWSIRLSQSDRVVFRINDIDHICVIEAVGGHY
ncbi:hypothetical protein VCSRO198_3525 [Vibrio cholerae]|nr:hypothetical protein AL543_05135 [Vibrio mimicus]EGR2120235.1 hypothetical protein [Vibrio cholerae]EGR4303492.1 hypothetical protein [Vibrio cholerae]EGR4429604.1 hypothetical protein [Vibrio cholerae]EGR4451953.1 hypothetical protein [Vibrio cholerae]